MQKLKLIIFHVDWLKVIGRSKLLATPLRHACTDYGLLDQTSLHSVNTSFSP